MRIGAKLILIAVGAFAALQFLRPPIPAKPAASEIQAPPEIKRILEKSCYSCHSDQRRLSWFDEIVPGYWLVRRDILTARQHLNFSTIGSKPAAAQRAALFEAVTMIQLGAMPLPQFLRLHPDAKVAPEDLATLKAYLAPWSTSPAIAGATPSEIPARANLASVAPEFNGFPFDPTFESWKLLSITDRGDNNSFRFILGNDIAVKAAHDGNISPWPDGARFAKIAWQQQSVPNGLVGTEGLILPGKFIQVEFMLKGAAAYKHTEGWNWGRWRGLDLKPYGADAHFVGECTGCHQPVRGNDYVYTLPISAAGVRVPKSNVPEAVNNAAAALPATLPWQPLGWNAITMYVDPKNRTTAVLFGNATRGAATILALVTWTQRDDPHWFGARIPDNPLSVEFVQIAPPGQQPTYRRFAGPLLAEVFGPANAAQRAEFIIALPPAQLP